MAMAQRTSSSFTTTSPISSQSSEQSISSTSITVPQIPSISTTNITTSSPTIPPVPPLPASLEEHARLLNEEQSKQLAFIVAGFSGKPLSEASSAYTRTFPTRAVRFLAGCALSLAIGRGGKLFPKQPHQIHANSRVICYHLLAISGSEAQTQPVPSTSTAAPTSIIGPGTFTSALIDSLEALPEAASSERGFLQIVITSHTTPIEFAQVPYLYRLFLIPKKSPIEILLSELKPDPKMQAAVSSLKTEVWSIPAVGNPVKKLGIQKPPSTTPVQPEDSLLPPEE